VDSGGCVVAAALQRRFGGAARPVLRSTERIGLIASIPLLLIGWVLVEGFWALFTGTATDVGTNPLMILLAVQLFALSLQRAPHAVRDTAVTAAAVS
jgi:hypothetical protein